VVKAGEPATFAWQVKPTDAAKGPLKTEFGVALNGTQPAQTFSLGSIARQVAPLQEAMAEKTQGLKTPCPTWVASKRSTCQVSAGYRASRCWAAPWCCWPC
jgi:hypothetical protein